jgi:toxin YoeB
VDKIWSDGAWDDYLHWQTQDQKTLRRVNQLLLDIDRNSALFQPGFYRKFCISC